MTKLTVTTTVKAPLATVRDARNNPTHIINRCFAGDDRHCPRATNDLQVGGILLARMEAKDGSFGFDMTGQYTLVEAMTKISYTMGSYEKDSDFVDAGRVVDITFTSLPEKGGAEGGGFDGVVVTETFDAEEIHDLEMQTAGWQSILDHFKGYAESL